MDMKKFLSLLFLLAFVNRSPAPVAMNSTNGVFALMISGTNAMILLKNPTNQAFSPSYLMYPSYGGIWLGTNFAGGGAGGSIAMPVEGRIQWKDGSFIWGIGSHGSQSSSNPTDGRMLINGAKGMSLTVGANGDGQIGTTLSTNNETWGMQYADDFGNSHLWQFKTSLNGDPARAALHGRHSPVNSYADTDGYAQSPTWNTFPTVGFLTAGRKVWTIDTDVNTNSGFYLYGRTTQARSAVVSTNTAIDFAGPYLQDISPSNTSVSFSLSNLRVGATNYISKLLYIHSGVSTLTILWPTNISWPTNVSTPGLGPTNLTPGQILRVPLESVGATNISVVCPSVSYIDDTSIYDQDALTYFTSVLNNGGGILTVAQKLALNAFVVERKASNVWTTAEYIAPFIGGSSNAHAVYLKGSGSITWSNAPTHDANGVTFNGSTQFGNTGFIPSAASVYSLNSALLCIVIPTASATNIGSSKYYTGVIGANNGRASIYRNNASSLGQQGLNFTGGSGAFLFFPDERGVYLYTRTGSTAQKAYFWQRTTAIGSSADGTATDATTSVASPDSAIYIGGRNSSSAVDSPAAYTLCGWEVGSGLTDAQALSVRNAWARLQNTLGR